MKGGKRGFVRWLIKDMKPYLDLLRDYDRGRVREKKQRNKKKL